MSRGSGRTTQQMQVAPRNSYFVWVNTQLEYPKRLAQCIDRDDLKIVGPYWLTERRYEGLELSGLVIDHAMFDVHRTATQADDLQYNIERAMTRVRKETT